MIEQNNSNSEKANNDIYGGKKEENNLQMNIFSKSQKNEKSD